MTELMHTLSTLGATAFGRSMGSSRLRWRAAGITRSSREHKRSVIPFRSSVKLQGLIPTSSQAARPWAGGRAGGCDADRAGHRSALGTGDDVRARPGSPLLCEVCVTDYAIRDAELDLAVVVRAIRMLLV